MYEWGLREGGGEEAKTETDEQHTKIKVSEVLSHARTSNARRSHSCVVCRARVRKGCELPEEDVRRRHRSLCRCVCAICGAQRWSGSAVDAAAAAAFARIACFDAGGAAENSRRIVHPAEHNRLSSCVGSLVCTFFRARRAHTRRSNSGARHPSAADPIFERARPVRKLKFGFDEARSCLEQANIRQIVHVHCSCSLGYLLICRLISIAKKRQVALVARHDARDTTMSAPRSMACHNKQFLRA